MVNERSLGAPHGVRSILGWIQTEPHHPFGHAGCLRGLIQQAHLLPAIKAIDGLQLGLDTRQEARPSFFNATDNLGRGALDLTHVRFHLPRLEPLLAITAVLIAPEPGKARWFCH